MVNIKGWGILGQNTSKEVLAKGYVTVITQEEKSLRELVPSTVTIGNESLLCSENNQSRLQKASAVARLVVLCCACASKHHVVCGKYM